MKGDTPLDALIEALETAGTYNPAAQAAPEAVLWCEEGEEFVSLLPMLRARLPNLFTLGEIDAASRTGPAVWLRVKVAEATGKTPVLYLSGVGRETLRDAETCPALLSPLTWLGFSGAWFGHVNGKDWTLRGFLAAERGSLNLEVADDSATRAALAEAARVVFARPLADLTGRRWDADSLHALLAPDLEADMLAWMAGDLPEARLKAFTSRAVKDLGFDPRKLSRQDAARRLTRKEGGWAQVWGRFVSSNGLGLDAIVDLLRLEESGDLFQDNDAYPIVNARREEELRQALLRLGGVARDHAATEILKLEGVHGPRRETVWGRRGEAPLARALGRLAVIAQAPGWPAHDPHTFAAEYAQSGARIDGAALEALAAAPGEGDRAAVSVAVRSVYLPWVEEGALTLQGLVKSGALSFKAEPAPTAADAVVFVDGLRMDLGIALTEALEKAGAAASLDWRWTGFPTSTATCKPLASPVAALLHGEAGSLDLTPSTPEGRSADHVTLRKLMAAHGWGFDEAAPRCWLETGTFDEDGHSLQARLADQIEQGVANCAAFILRLARAGRRVRVVTDHGWLLIPGGLEKAILDTAVVEADGKRTRCARIKDGAPTTYDFAPWSWNGEVRVAFATGAMSFFAGYDYAHGGISPQECITPVIDVAPLGAVRTVSIASVEWAGLRLRVETVGGADLRVDLRAGDETSGPSLLKAVRGLDENGRASMPVSDDHEGKTATVVVLDDDDRVLAWRTVEVGR